MRTVLLALSMLAIGLVAGVVLGTRLHPETPESRTFVREAARDAPHESRVGGPAPSRPSPSAGSEVRSRSPGPVTTADSAAEAGRAVEPDEVLGETAILRDLLGGVLFGAGLEPDDGQQEALESLVSRMATLFKAAASHDGTATERMALRREAEVVLERGLVDILRTGQLSELDRALRGRAVVEVLPGGQEGDTLSSTGIDEEKAATMVLANFRKRIGLTDDAHFAVHLSIARYVRGVVDLNETLEARWGRGFVEAVCSGPTPHTEAGREARAEPGYARRELEARAALWRLQADLERSLGPLLTEEQREALRVERPTALRFLTSDED